MQITIAITLPYHQFKEWSKENVKTRRNAADRGPHEAEQEKTKFLGPKFCRSGIGILRKGESH
ncbi:hypothetical protein T01_2258 [Trichinella spiralis]|uniref:Uncharacterized protein n=1 Tax=Trichinella spiralis TaxID=6334 RepID=A0A0V1B9I6_TRISP|nr:hypothetical protein T01_2258 [Trichinella spiralis]